MEIKSGTTTVLGGRGGSKQRYKCRIINYTYVGNVITRDMIKTMIAQG
jgi:hypothetical protein